jgi:transposase-like protein
MSRRYQRAVLPIKAVPAALLQSTAACPTCGRSNSNVLGRMGLRLVFQCSDCHVEFFRHTGQASAAF